METCDVIENFVVNDWKTPPSDHDAQYQLELKKDGLNGSQITVGSAMEGQDGKGQDDFEYEEYARAKGSDYVKFNLDQSNGYLDKDIMLALDSFKPGPEFQTPSVEDASPTAPRRDPTTKVLIPPNEPWKSYANSIMYCVEQFNHALFQHGLYPELVEEPEAKGKTQPGLINAAKVLKYFQLLDVKATGSSNEEIAAAIQTWMLPGKWTTFKDTLLHFRHFAKNATMRKKNAKGEMVQVTRTQLNSWIEEILHDGNILDGQDIQFWSRVLNKLQTRQFHNGPFSFQWEEGSDGDSVEKFKEQKEHWNDDANDVMVDGESDDEVDVTATTKDHKVIVIKVMDSNGFVVTGKKNKQYEVVPAVKDEGALAKTDGSNK